MVFMDDSGYMYIASLKQQKAKKMILLVSTFTLSPCAAKVYHTSVFVVLLLRYSHCRPYRSFDTVEDFKN